jgi:MoaA/NifB/PqqE/SkfB family radical SAM enzyme
MLGFIQRSKRHRLIDLESVDTIQVDHNSTCNLLCPQCARVVNGKLNSGLPMKYLPLQFYEKIFTKSLCHSVRRVFFCGNYGDVAASPNFLEVCSYLKTNGLRSIGVVTNGSINDPVWWRHLAEILDPNTDRVSFSIDGLADTNHTYRVGSQFGRIMENASAFIEAGGDARWEYLVFAHNEHQVDEAKTLARSMGFSSFKVKKTNRFIHNKHYRSGKAEVSFPLAGRARKLASEIKAPSDEKYVARSSTRFDQIVEKYGSWQSYTEKAEIRCKAQGERTIFIDFEGRVWPCTWLAAPVYFAGDQNIQKRQILDLLDSYGHDFNNLFEHSLSGVLEHEWFASELTKSWSGSSPDGARTKLMTCGRTCGHEYEFSSNADENKILEKL